MVSIRNLAKERLEAGDLALGIGLRLARTVEIGKLMKTAGYDFLFIDMEHGSMSVDLAAQLSIAAQDAGITPVVRVPGFEHFHASRVLDAGAQGIVVPHVDTPEVAARMVSNCRYPPVGHRSVTGAVPQLDFETHPMAEWTKAVNDATLLILMVESPQALENIDRIAAVPGFDALLVGTNDLCIEMGIPGQLEHPRVVERLPADRRRLPGERQIRRPRRGLRAAPARSATSPWASGWCSPATTCRSCSPPPGTALRRCAPCRSVDVAAWLTSKSPLESLENPLARPEVPSSR